jgi:hypothetical protein
MAAQPSPRVRRFDGLKARPLMNACGAGHPRQEWESMRPGFEPLESGWRRSHRRSSPREINHRVAYRRSRVTVSVSEEY